MNTNQRNLIAALSLCAAVVPNLASAVAVNGQGTWESTLQGRDLDGNVATFEAYYDTILDITWLADAHYGQRTGPYFYDLLDWYTAGDWIAGLNPYGSGVTGWRLPTTTDTGTRGCNQSNTGGTDCGYNVSTASSEMAHMFYSTLGNLSYYSTSGAGNQPDGGLTNTGPFSILPSIFWSGTGYTPITSMAWTFNFSDGEQFPYGKLQYWGVWAVHTGDVGVSAVPLPAAVWLFTSGFLGLIGLARRNQLA